VNMSERGIEAGRSASTLRHAYERALAHRQSRQGGQAASARDHRTLESRGALAEVRAAQTELGTRRRSRGTSGGAAAARHTITDAAKFAKGAWQDDRSRRAADPRTAHQSDPTDARSQCPQCSIRIWPTSRAGLPRASADRDRHPRPAENRAPAESVHRNTRSSRGCSRRCETRPRIS